MAPSPLYGTYYHYSGLELGLGCELRVLLAILSTGSASSARGCWAAQHPLPTTCWS